MNMKTKLALFVILLSAITLLPQKVTNVDFEPKQNKIFITYDLDGEKDTEYEIGVVLKREEFSGFIFRPKLLTGDVGEGIKPGKGKEIVWDVTKEYHIDPDATDFYFEVTAQKISGGIAWYYYVGAAVLGSGTAAVLLLGKKSEEESPVTKTPIGTPPGRP